MERLGAIIERYESMNGMLIRIHANGDNKLYTVRINAGSGWRTVGKFPASEKSTMNEIARALLSMTSWQVTAIKYLNE